MLPTPPRRRTDGPAIAVLVVEDDDAVRELVGLTLAAAGYCVESARDGVEAVARLEAHDYGAVLTDFTMPRMNGLSLLGVVRERWPGMPVVFLSGEPGDAEALAIARGAYSWVPKPYETERLLQIVAGAVLHGRMVRPRVPTPPRPEPVPSH